MSADEPFVSVVTPFYNTDLYLEQCIQSVLAQSHANFEYLLVDNQSKDGSGAIAKKYATLDERIRLIVADRFRSQLDNYSFALEQCSPDARYVKVAQADDWLFPRCIAEMVELAEANPSVGVVSAYDLRETEVYGFGLRPEQRVLTGREAGRAYFIGGLFLFGSPTTVLYRGDVVRSRKPFFVDGVLHSDTEAVLDILTRRDFGFVHQVLSFIRVQEDSYTGRSRDYVPNDLDRLTNVKRFGELYLDADEYRICLDRAFSDYYRKLARKWLRFSFTGANEAFWKYQRDGLALIGETLEWSRLGRALGAVVAEEVLNPERLVRRMVQEAGSRRMTDS
jgi:glycosyltransferase involved in cell wall biosynthesis